jgi:hypothetical protein
MRPIGTPPSTGQNLSNRNNQAAEQRINTSDVSSLQRNISTTGNQAANLLNAGSWSALDAKTGKILSQTAGPASAIDTASVSVARVVYAGSYTG